MPYPIKAKQVDSDIHSNPSQITFGKDIEEMDEAVNRVYRQYGSDLPAFFRDIQHKLALKREEIGHSFGSDNKRP